MRGIVLLLAATAATLHAAEPDCGARPRAQVCICLATVGPTCPSRGYWNAPYTTPFYPICTPRFAGGEPLGPEPHIETVIRLQPISSIPKEPPPARLITSEPPRPRRPLIDFDKPSDTPNPDMPRPNGGPKLHLLLLVDNDAKDLGKTFAAGADLIAELFKAGVRAERIGAKVRLGSTDLNAESINRTIADLPVRASDTLVVYYAGPAANDGAGMSVALTPSQGTVKLPRDTLRKQITERGARLAVFLTDPAANLAILEPPGKPEPPAPAPGSLEKLLFGFKGVVDVHAHSVGEFAAPRGVYGGCFTVAFAREFSRPAGNWADLLEAVKFTTNNLFKSYRLDVLRSDDLPAALRTTYRNQESQVPALLTPIDNLKPVENGSYKRVVPADSPAAAPQRQPARVVLRVPAAASVTVDGMPTTRGFSERDVATAPLEPGRDHMIEVRVEINGWGGVYQLAVRAGETARAELQVPAEVQAHIVVATSVPE